MRSEMLNPCREKVRLLNAYYRTTVHLLEEANRLAEIDTTDPAFRDALESVRDARESVEMVRLAIELHGEHGPRQLRQTASTNFWRPPNAFNSSKP